MTNLLLQAFPQAVMVAEEQGCLPLHLAAAGCQDDEGAAVLDRLIKTCPQAAAVSTADERLPLHMSGSEHAANALLTAWPGAAFCFDRAGLLPVVTVYRGARTVILHQAPLTAMHFRGRKVRPELSEHLRRAAQQVHQTMVSARVVFRGLEVC